MADEFMRVKELLDELWNKYADEASEQELDVPPMSPTKRLQDFFLFVVETSTYCAIHDNNEIVLSKGRVCFECKHSYLDDDEIKAAFLELMENTPSGQILPDSIVILKGDTVDDIGFCPLCLHDW
jgi:hypothetical protein